MSTAPWFSLKGFLRSRRQNLSLVQPSCFRKPKGNFDECRTDKYRNINGGEREPVLLLVPLPSDWL